MTHVICLLFIFHFPFLLSPFCLILHYLYDIMITSWIISLASNLLFLINSLILNQGYCPKTQFLIMPLICSEMLHGSPLPRKLYSVSSMAFGASIVQPLPIFPSHLPFSSVQTLHPDTPAYGAFHKPYSPILKTFVYSSFSDSRSFKNHISSKASLIFPTSVIFQDFLWTSCR